MTLLLDVGFYFWYLAFLSEPFVHFRQYISCLYSHKESCACVYKGFLSCEKCFSVCVVLHHLPLKGCSFPWPLAFSCFIVFFSMTLVTASVALGFMFSFHIQERSSLRLPSPSWIMYPVCPPVSFPWLNHTRFVLVHNKLPQSSLPCLILSPTTSLCYEFLSLPSLCVKITSYLPYQNPLWHFFSQSCAESISGCPLSHPQQTWQWFLDLLVPAGQCSRNVWGGLVHRAQLAPPWSWSPTQLSCSSALCHILKLRKPRGRHSSFVLFSKLRKWIMTAPWAALLVMHPKPTHLWF